MMMIYEDSYSMCHLSMHMHNRMNLIQIQINEINEIRWDHMIFNNACKPDGGLHPVRSQGAADILLISSFVGDLYGVASYYQYSQLVLTCPITYRYHFFCFCIIFASLQNHFTNKKHLHPCFPERNHRKNIAHGPCMILKPPQKKQGLPWTCGGKFPGWSSIPWTFLGTP